MINSALSIEDRDAIDEDTLAILSTAEIICDKALQDGMDAGHAYKKIYGDARTKVHDFAEMAIPFELGE